MTKDLLREGTVWLALVCFQMSTAQTDTPVLPLKPGCGVAGGPADTAPG